MRVSSEASPLASQECPADPIGVRVRTIFCALGRLTQLEAYKRRIETGRMASRELTIDEQDQLIAKAVERDEPRLRSFIRKRVLDMADAEDVLQDVFYELISAYRMMKPVEQVTAWMFRVARNRIMDLFRRKKAVSLNEPVEDDDGAQTLEACCLRRMRDPTRSTRGI